MVGAETASTAGTNLWDSTALDGTRATNVVPSPNPRCLPGWSRAQPTLQEWGSTVVATTHLACALSRCLTPSDCAHMARHASLWFEPLQHAQLTMHHRFHQSHSVLFWAHTCKSFLPYFDALGQVLPLVSDRMTPCPINPSLSVLGSDQASRHRAQSTQASRCLGQTKPLCAWLVLSSSLGGEGERRHRQLLKKKKKWGCYGGGPANTAMFL